MSWKPIDTAPKGEHGDSQILVLFCSAGEFVVRLCWWNDGSAHMNGHEKPDPEAVGWWSYRHSVTQEQVDWMPAVAWMEMPYAKIYDDILVLERTGTKPIA